MPAPTVCFTVDYEPDCPPYLAGTYRGVEEATLPLLGLLEEFDVPATWFSTGEVAERYPDAVRAIVAAGHELGCHGVPLVVADGVPQCIKVVRQQLRRGAKCIKICTSGGVSSDRDDPKHQQFSDEEIRAMVEEAARSGDQNWDALPQTGLLVLPGRATCEQTRD